MATGQLSCNKRQSTLMCKGLHPLQNKAVSQGAGGEASEQRRCVQGTAASHM